MSTFLEMLHGRWAKGLFVCVGLDSEVEKIPATKDFIGGVPESVVFNFNKAIINATADYVCAYKPNIAFYEERGEKGIEVLQETIFYLKQNYPEIPVILDSKRGDIGNTNNGYVKSAFEYFEADAITINPYLGSEANKPFLERDDKGIIVLCRTSNPGAGEFQDRLTFVSWEELEGLISQDIVTSIRVCKWQEASGGVLMPLYHLVALNVARKWNINNNCAIVAGATYPEELGMLRFLTDNLPFLIPGIGAQGGDVEKTVKAGIDFKGAGMIINSSRGIIFASKGEDFAEAARRETIRLTELINQFK
jgi:orotidine-5'-phosphate decarboxylase